MGAVAPGCPHCTLVPRLLVDLGPAPPQPSSAPPASPLPGGEPAEEDEEEEVPELGDGEGRAGGRGGAATILLSPLSLAGDAAVLRRGVRPHLPGLHQGRVSLSSPPMKWAQHPQNPVGCPERVPHETPVLREGALNRVGARPVLGPPPAPQSRFPLPRTQINFTVAIDFTASNGERSRWLQPGGSLRCHVWAGGAQDRG